MVSGQELARWQGPRRAAVAVALVGVLAVWLVTPVGNPCPDLDRLPQGSTAHSSPSFSPPGTRTCTYTAAGGTQARARYVPWLGWIVVVLLAALAAAAVSLASPSTRRARAQRIAAAGRDERSADRARAARAPRSEAAREGSGLRAPKPAARRDRRMAGRGGTRSSRSASPERDAAERERARRERAERDRSRRDR